MQDVEAVIEEIQHGNESLREDLIVSHKPFIYNYTSMICKRKLDPANDDELSIALLAFNNAIDRFRAGYGSSFPGFARVLIKNSLIDYFRSQAGISSIPLAAGGADEQTVGREEEASIDAYGRELEERERAFELQLLDEKLAAFGLNLSQLPKQSPKHDETRRYLRETAEKIASGQSLVSKMHPDKKASLQRNPAFNGGSPEKPGAVETLPADPGYHPHGS